MTQGKHIDCQLMHEFFWRRSDHQNLLKMHQENLAADLGVVPETISRMLKRMVEEGRIRKMFRKKLGQVTYLINDPEVWKNRQKALKESE